jgi:hypothetical protein
MMIDARLNMQLGHGTLQAALSGAIRGKRV